MNTLAKTDAVKLDKEIRSTVAAIWDNFATLQALIGRAIDGDLGPTLGYPSTKAYLKDVLADQPKLGSQKDRERRNQIIALLRQASNGPSHLTQKDIATILGISQRTVSNAVQQDCSTDQPATVIGADGKTYPTTKKKRQPAQPDSWYCDGGHDALGTPAHTDGDKSYCPQCVANGGIVIDAEIVDDEIFYDIDDSADPKTPADHMADINRLTMKLENAKRVLIDALKITQDLYQYDATIKTILDGWIPDLKEILIAIEATAVGTDLDEGLQQLLAEGI